MAKSQNFHRKRRVSHQTENCKNERYYRKKLIIKSNAKIEVGDGYIIIKKSDGEFVISFKKIYALYLGTNITISLHDLFYLTNFFRVYLIDVHGYILGRVVNYAKK